jgi:2-polyprenyl-3-methyl-5-hydroxy-6-metoxy-1,4-benzoquinol methylase
MQADSDSDYQYAGDELELFKHCSNWKSYMLAAMKPYLKGDVLEVGAGIGGTTQLLCTPGATSWTALEPDSVLLETFTATMEAMSFSCPVKPVVGTVTDLPADAKFDAIIYVDVLEHIEHDGPELQNAAQHLRPGGHLIVLSPAHQFLYSPFDEAIGHFRRYNADSLRSLSPAQLKLTVLRYMDMVGMMASLANHSLLKQSMPNARQLWVWDKAMVPISRLIDPLFGYSLGKSILAVWTLTGSR